MKLSEVHIENFKSLKEISIQLNGDINLLIGKNNSGKSNLIEGLRYLSETIVEGLKPEDFIRFIFSKNISNLLSYKLTFALSEEEKSQLLSNFNFTSEEKTEINGYFGTNIEYTIGFGKMQGKITILNENVSIYLENKEIIISKGIWEENSYNYFILDEFYNTAKNINSIVSSGSNDHTSIRGRSSPATSILRHPNYGNLCPEEYLLKFIWDYLENISYLRPFRDCRESEVVRGFSRLSINGYNLPQVLNYCASSNEACFKRIVKHVESVTDNVLGIRAPLKPGTDQTYIAIKEEGFEDIEFTWDSISSGIKEVIFLITFLNSSEKGSLLMIEEPEIHLHGDALKRFFSVLESIVEEDEKQIIISTHSPKFVDLVDKENIFCVVKEGGCTDIIPLSQESSLERTTLVKAGLTISDILISQVPSFLLIVEGRDDHFIFKEFLRKEGINSRESRIYIIPSSEEGGVIRFGRVLRRTRTGIPFLLVKNSDRKPDEKIREVKDAGFREDEYLILEKGEIEDYLIDSDAIARIADKSPDEVEKIILDTSGTGKEKLKNVLNKLGIPPDRGVKVSITRYLESTPQEIKEKINFIKSFI